MPPILTTMRRQSNLLFDTDSDLNKRRLVRNADFIRWLWITFRRTPSTFTKPIMIGSETELNQFLTQAKIMCFRSKCLISLDMEYVRVKGRPYNQYPVDAKHFSPNSGFPSHPDFPYHIVRYILLGLPYGETAVVNAALMTRKMRDDLIKFLMNPDTVVCTFNFQNDAFMFHLTFGDRPISYADYSTKLTKTGKENYRKTGILSKLRIFDLANVLAIAKRNNFDTWEKVGLVPEGEGLWHLAQSALCVDLAGNDVTNVYTINEFWNCSDFSTAQSRYVQIDAQTCVCTFLCLLRYGLIPDAQKLFSLFPHDTMLPLSIACTAANLTNLDTETLYEYIIHETAVHVNFRDGTCDLKQFNGKSCLGHISNPETNKESNSQKYVPCILPLVHRTINTKGKNSVKNDKESLDKREDSGSKSADQAKDGIPFDPKGIANWPVVPGRIPYFFYATAPRSQCEAERLYGEVCKHLRSLCGTDAAKVATLNWINPDGTKTKELENFIFRLPKYAQTKDCLNNFDTSYPLFQASTNLLTADFVNPDSSYIEDPKYKSDPYYGLHLFTVIPSKTGILGTTLPSVINFSTLNNSDLVDETTRQMSLLNCNLTSNQRGNVEGSPHCSNISSFSEARMTIKETPVTETVGLTKLTERTEKRQHEAQPTLTKPNLKPDTKETAAALFERAQSTKPTEKVEQRKDEPTLTKTNSKTDTTPTFRATEKYTPRQPHQAKPGSFQHFSRVDNIRKSLNSDSNFNSPFVNQLIRTTIDLQKQNNQLREELNTCQKQLSSQNQAYNELLTRYQQIEAITKNFSSSTTTQTAIAQSTTAGSSLTGSSPSSTTGSVNAAAFKATNPGEKTLTMPSRHGRSSYVLYVDNPLILGNSLTKGQVTIALEAFKALQSLYGRTGSFCTLKRHWLAEQCRQWVESFTRETALYMAKIILRIHFLTAMQPNTITSENVATCDKVAGKVFEDVTGFLDTGELLSVKRKVPKGKRIRSGEGETESNGSVDVDTGSKRFCSPNQN